MSIYEQFQEMLSKGRLPIMEFELNTGDYLVVGIMVEQGHTSVSADFLCLPVWFEEELAAVSGSEYRINLEDYPFRNINTLDQLLEFIHDNIMEGFLIPNNLLPEDSQ